MSTLEIIQTPPATLEIIQTPAPILEIVTGGRQGPAGVAGPQGPVGDVSYTYQAAVDIDAFKMVAHDAAGQLVLATNNNLIQATRVYGIATAAALTGVVTNVRMFGQVTNPAWNWTADMPIYLGEAGVLTQSVPAGAGRFLLLVGYPISATSMFIRPLPPIVLT